MSSYSVRALRLCGIKTYFPQKRKTRKGRFYQIFNKSLFYE